MRLDKYLKVSRIVKRRTVANELCDAGRVIVNGNPAKASYDVAIGDVVEVGFGGKKLKAKIKEIKEHVRKEEASELYDVILDERPQT